jgi:hypothetical protein
MSSLDVALGDLVAKNVRPPGDTDGERGLRAQRAARVGPEKLNRASGQARQRSSRRNRPDCQTKLYRCASRESLVRTALSRSLAHGHSKLNFFFCCSLLSAVASSTRRSRRRQRRIARRTRRIPRRCQQRRQRRLLHLRQRGTPSTRLPAGGCWSDPPREALERRCALPACAAAVRSAGAAAVCRAGRTLVRTVCAGRRPVDERQVWRLAAAAGTA